MVKKQWTDLGTGRLQKWQIDYKWSRGALAPVCFRSIPK